MRPMLVLDTSTERPALGLALPDGTARASQAGPPRRHGVSLVPAIRDLLKLEGLSTGDLRSIAVGLGPGSFTGLRIGLTAAKVLAHVGGLPLIGLDSLEAIARNAPDDETRIRVVVDAQRGDVFAADFRRERAGFPLRVERPTGLERLADWAERSTPEDLILGPALDRLATTWPVGARLGSPEIGLPNGMTLASLAIEVAETGRRDDPSTLEPVYFRKSAAEEKAGLS